MESRSSQYKAVVMGTSAGGLYVLFDLLKQLPKDYPLPVMIVQHRSKDQRELLEEILQNRCSIRIQQAEEKEQIAAGNVYIAPPDYHLLVESDFTLSLSADEHVSYSRPSIDILFESAAFAYGPSLIGIILTGANSDGAAGLATIRQQGGLTIAQDPEEAAFPMMPASAIKRGVDHVWTLKQIGAFLIEQANTK